MSQRSSALMGATAGATEAFVVVPFQCLKFDCGIRRRREGIPLPQMRL